MVNTEIGAMMSTKMSADLNDCNVMQVSFAESILNHKVVGSVERVRINGIDVLARMDTGAGRSSICKTLAKKLRLGPPIKGVVVRSVHGRSIRPVVQAGIIIKGRKIKANFTVTDRSGMKFDVLIGRNILKRGFLVDSSK